MMNDVQSLLIDIDGTLYDGETVIEGAVEALTFLRERGIPFLLVTNTTRMAKSEIMARLTRLRIEVAEDEIFPVPAAACEYMKQRHGSRCFVIGAPNIDVELETIGLTVVRTEEPVDFVVISQYKWIDFGEIDIAYRLIQRGAEPIAMHQDMTYPDNGVLRASLGPIVVGLEALTGVPATVVGKPNARFFQLALAHAGFKDATTVMIGDNLTSDIVGAANAGLRSIQVQTGAYHSNDRDASVRPTWTLASIADLPNWFDRPLR